MRKVWIVVANKCIARIYHAENVKTLVEHKCFEHAEAHEPARELMSDHLGRATQKGFVGSDTMDVHTSLKAKEATIFARQLSSFLQESFNAGEFEALYIVAKVPFLGFLREVFPPGITKLIKSEINKDLTHMTPAEIREYLPPVL